MKYSLFIGRWQPFHAGHKAIIVSVIEEGKRACIAIRDTNISVDNPYSIEDRMKQILETMSDYIDEIKIIVIPDIDAVCYGRDVGYDIKQIHVSQELENISGTKLRGWRY